MTLNRLILIATTGSVALIAGALFFQSIGYAPCAMCHWQRWPHYTAIVIGIIALLLPQTTAKRVFAGLGALAALTTSGIGFFHAGVELKWWPGPQSCTGSGLGGLSGGDLLSMDGPRIIMCDQVSWAFMGISMAGWNAIISLFIAMIWLRAAIKGR
ncbi:disulfide bond formation protein B [Ketogulonicigenium vulgare]|uniref:Disulfide bond formation protein, DsbB family protein n=1 Tax=Ketogulonicigenium vulgare (strain WSH-001) TaxID=759362 RepID=F9Y6B9_KETVW|nr:disulfide bond formation protein B [Ketogulonicigenium vulgare]ADO42673.1 Disulfide bond formation protein DsbB [Ketogulonicigenium vulgare Y25]AEM40865.1 Disulfide bond formation protein, DsbB family protein [Ketogulonicigenium vulgare WSH-001]ALJ81024.1 dihydroneopterin aldolase [Ketogulonicigenium vulgare]ANW33783.1 dihydroneopterin aldolase [Ketogulonicigenium vulgare]AOZ54582.1 Disulfide bond formation protein DsbB [Ketogulonicigenium vulgare]